MCDLFSNNNNTRNQLKVINCTGTYKCPHKNKYRDEFNKIYSRVQKCIIKCCVGDLNTTKNKSMCHVHKSDEYGNYIYFIALCSSCNNGRNRQDMKIKDYHQNKLIYCPDCNCCKCNRCV